MIRTMVRRRLVVYLQLSFLFVGAVYLLLGYGTPSTAAWGIPRYPVDQWLPKPQAHVTATRLVSASPMPHLIPTAAGTHAPTPTKVLVGEKDEHFENWKQNKVDELEKERASKATDAAEDDDENGEEEGDTHRPESTTTTTGAPTAAAATSQPTKEDLLAKAHTMIPSILDPSDTSVDRMMCPPVNTTRYAHLKTKMEKDKHQYFFALNLRKCVDLLPRLLGSVLEAVTFLGPQHCAISVVEGNSDDGTPEVLELLRPELDRLNITYYLQSSTLDPSDGQRIEKLAMLRAMAVEPVTGIQTPRTVPNHTNSSDANPAGTVPRLPLAEDATVLFLNDVSACAEDILELLHQRVAQSADMTCAMDWNHAGGSEDTDPLFYDVWVARAINGDTFFEIPPATGSWEYARDLFANEPIARSRLEAGKPFQVFACWNGAVAFTAKPLVDNEVNFRSVREGECFQGEPQVFCKDMWWHGFGRIGVVPSVNLEYSDENGRKVKREKGYVSDFVDREGRKPREGVEDVKDKIDWLGPPEMVKCMPTFQIQSWLPWNESLMDVIEE